ncbi:MAG: TonB-dependent receptor [Flavobacteriales bacterium]|jgi:hypothetical protein|nr:TonB-dependent receptor [Flavobacteriales bacterium]
MNNRTLSTCTLVLLPLWALAQLPVTGVVNGTDIGPLPGSNVHWLGTTVGTSTDADGRFSIPPPQAWPAHLVASFVGFTPDTLALEHPPAAPLRISLRSTVELRAVEVIERQPGTMMSTRTTMATEIIGQKELKRAACCDLSESFETSATVDVNYADAISGTKTIRMLGLDGRYAQMSVENLPFVRGLSANYGLTLLPGTWVQDINLSKGAGTAVNGPNAITGQIDLCLLDPLAEPPLFVNLYGNSQGRAEANVHAAQRTGKSSANLLMLHGNLFRTDMDQNHDGFMDAPMTRRINIMDRWMLRDERRSLQVTGRYVFDERTGGSSHMAPAANDHTHHLQGRPYALDIRNEMVDLFGKYGVVFKNDPTKSVGFLFAARRHDVSALFGPRGYGGIQESLYGSAVYQMLLGTGTDQLKGGLSFQYDYFSEAFRPTVQAADSLFGRTEHMPGIFAEYTRQRNDLTLVAGLRADANSVYGPVVSPRLHLKYDLGPLTNLRFSVGHGFRTANPLIENATVLASSRRVVVEGEPGMERAWNVGGSFLHKFKWLDRKWAFGVDLYRTTFTDQLVVDLDRGPQVVAFYMLDGRSYANSVLSDLQIELVRQLELKLSYRWYDVQTTYDGVLRTRPFTPSHRGLVSLAYADMKERWRFDVSLSLFGEGRAPDTAENPEPYRFRGTTPAYPVLHAQVTRVLGAWEVYLGGENITSTLQQHQIIAPEDPFGPYFDASMIWGPTNKALVYGGLRFALARKPDAAP